MPGLSGTVHVLISSRLTNHESGREAGVAELLIWASIAYVGVGLPVVYLANALRRFRGRRRNDRGRCGVCGAELHTQPDPEAFRIDGIIVCTGCAARARRSMLVSMWSVVGVGIGLPIATGVVLALTGWSWPAMLVSFLPAGVVGTALSLEVKRMKRANRRAELAALEQELITGGEVTDTSTS